MARAYSLELRERVLEAVAAGLPLAEAARRFRVSVASIARWRALERRQGSARPRPYAGGRRPRQTEAARATTLALLEEDPLPRMRSLRCPSSLARRPRGADIIPSPSVPRSLCRLPYGGQARECQTGLGK